MKKSMSSVNKYKEKETEEQNVLIEYEQLLDLTNTRDNKVSESELIKDFSPVILAETNRSIKVGNNLGNDEDSDIYGYLFLLNNKVVSMQQNKEYIYSNLTTGQEYKIEIIAIDKYGNFKKSKSITKKTESVKARYVVVDIFDHIGGDYAALGELEVYNVNNQQIDYTILNAYDSASNGLPPCWNNINYWNYSNLYDGQISHSSNQEGGQNCTGFLGVDQWHGTSANSGYWARFIIDLGSIENLNDIKIAIGNSENRTPKSVSTYIVENYVEGTGEGSTYKKNISNRNNEGLMLTHTQTFTSVVIIPTWYSFIE